MILKKCLKLMIRNGKYNKKDNLNNIFKWCAIQKCQKLNKYIKKIYKINKNSGQIQRNVLD